jgi:Domain of unknown function (DUF4815)
MIHGRLGQKHLTLDKQVAMIEGHGQQVVVFPVLQCPCLREERQFNPLCPACRGAGTLYPTVLAYATRMLLHRESSARDYLEPGTWYPGTIRASILPGILLAERDKVRMLAIRATYNDEVLVRGLDDRLRFSAGVVLRAVSDLTTVYTQGLDYRLDPPQTIAWLAGGQGPALGAQYSVRYEAYVEYLVSADLPRLRVEHDVPQSQEVVLMRLDVLSDEPAP